MLIDFHTHCFPDALAPRAIEKLSAIGGIPALTDGTAAGLMQKMEECGVARAVICNIATNDRQTANVNRFAIETRAAYPRLCPLGSVNPMSSPDFIAGQLAALHEAGIPGIKIHPDYMGVELDDPRFDGIFEQCEALGMFVITHAGWDFVSPDRIHAGPERTENVLKRHPKLTLVAAHFGGNRQWDEVEQRLIGRNVWLDVSLTAMFALDPAQFRRMLLAHDPERLLFGSDLPWADPAETLRKLESLALPAALMDQITYQNAEALIGKGN